MQALYWKLWKSNFLTEMVSLKDRRIHQVRVSHEEEQASKERLLTIIIKIWGFEVFLGFISGLYILFMAKQRASQ